VAVPEGTLLHEALERAGITIDLPCGGQGRCGRCVVIVHEGPVRRRSTARLTPEEIRRGYALACQTVVAGDLRVEVPLRQELERLESADRADKTAPEVVVCDHPPDPWVAGYHVVIPPPSLGDNTADLERLQRELALQHGIQRVQPTYAVMQELPNLLRDAEWDVTAVLERGQPEEPGGVHRLLALRSGERTNGIYGAAVDVGTTSVVVYLADLATRGLVGRASAYNGQIPCGEDIISRIIYSRQPGRREELQRRVLQTINTLLEEVLSQQGIAADDVYRVTVAGNTTMTHLLLGIEPQHIRLEPYIPGANQPPAVRAGDLGIHVNPDATVDCLPAVGAYVGGDITAGVLRSRMAEEEAVSLFIDVGTNGEIVLGNNDWLIACACSAGPAFEGAGASSGTRAVRGAVEEVWIDPETLHPTVRTIGDAPPVGICGSGMISLLGEMLMAGVMDKSGHLAPRNGTTRVRSGTGGLEYVVAWADETGPGVGDVVLTETDIENLLRAKAAIYAGFTVLADSVGFGMADIERVIIGGAFGQHIDVEKAIQIGLLPDMPWDRFVYLGNTSVQGAFQALTCRQHRAMVDELAAKMTYLELSADNRFMDAFTSALFLPHTDESLFPSVRRPASENQR